MDKIEMQIAFEQRLKKGMASTLKTTFTSKNQHKYKNTEHTKCNIIINKPRDNLHFSYSGPVEAPLRNSVCMAIMTLFLLL